MGGLTGQEVLTHLDAYMEEQALDGTLLALQRAVLAKGLRSLERDGHWPIVDYPLALSRVLGTPHVTAAALVGACALFYAFADITDDAQDHDLPDGLWDGWGWEHATNTGTSLLFLALQCLWDRLPDPAPLVRVFVRAGHEMTAGQHEDLLGRRAPAGWASYLQRIARKSAASFGAYAEVMALGTCQDPALAMRYREFGCALGMLFQMLNDTHDLWGGSLSEDLGNGCPSLPLVLAREQLSATSAASLEALLQLPATCERQEAVVQLLEEGGIRMYAATRIEVYRNRARELARDLGLEADEYLAQLLSLPTFPPDPVAI